MVTEAAEIFTEEGTEDEGSVENSSPRLRQQVIFENKNHKKNNHFASLSTKSADLIKTFT